MVKQEEEAASLVRLAESQLGGSFHPPIVPKQTGMLGNRAIYAGLYLMPARTGTGKTTISLAISLLLALPKGVVNYRSLLEPRSPSEGPDGFNQSLAMERYQDYLAQSVGAGARYLTLDSVTYLITAVGSKMLSGQEDVTMAGGLQRSDILGVLQMDALARQNELTVIATVNSELFPRPDALEGACEGIIKINYDQSITIRDRSNRRDESISIPSGALDAARKLLHQTTTETTYSALGRQI